MKPVTRILERYHGRLQQRGLFVPMHTHHCFWCEATLHDHTVIGSEETQDHLVPLANGGSNASSNLVRSCRLCNYTRGSTERLRFREIVDKIIRPHRTNYDHMMALLERVDHYMATRARSVLMPFYITPAQTPVEHVPGFFGEPEPMEMVVHGVTPWFWIGNTGSELCDRRPDNDPAAQKRGEALVGDVAMISTRKARGYVAQNGDFRLIGLSGYRRMCKEGSAETAEFRAGALWLFRWTSFTWGYDRVGILYCTDDRPKDERTAMCWTFENNPGAAYNLHQWALLRPEIATGCWRTGDYREAVVEVMQEDEEAA